MSSADEQPRDACVALTRLDGTAWIEIRRPARQNAIDHDVMAALETHLDVIEADEECVAVVLSSEGERAFIAGGDLKAFRDIVSPDEAYEMGRRMAEILCRLERLPALVVAVVEGYAFGGGCETLLACDWVVASNSSTFGLTQVRFAVTPGWGGGVRLVRKVGRAQALRLLLTAPTLSADEALSVGLIDEVAVDPMAAARALLGRVPRNRRLVSAIKQVVDAENPRLDAAIRRERGLFVDSWVDDAHAEAVATFFAGRGPRGSTTG